MAERPFTYRGWFGRHARRRCPHSRLSGIYGDAINRNDGYRLWCIDCGSLLDGPVRLSVTRPSPDTAADRSET